MLLLSSTTPLIARVGRVARRLRRGDERGRLPGVAGEGRLDDVVVDARLGAERQERRGAAVRVGVHLQRGSCRRTMPPPCLTVNVTGTPPRRLNPASVTTTTKGNASFAPSAPVWLLPVVDRDQRRAGRRAGRGEGRVPVEAGGRSLDPVAAGPGARAQLQRHLRAPGRVGRRPPPTAPWRPPPVTRPLLSVTREDDRRAGGTGCPRPS